MKKKLFITLILCLLLGLIVPVQASAAAKLNKTQVTLKVGKTYKLAVKGSKKKVTWKSSDKKVAAVNSAGKVTAKKAGTAKITAKVGTQTLKCTVKVTGKSNSGSNKTITNEWGAKVIIPKTMEDWLNPENRMKVTKVSFRAEPSTYANYYWMDVKFKPTQIGTPGRVNWGQYIYYYNKKGKKIGDSFLYCSPLKKNKTYEYAAQVPFGTVKIVFLEVYKEK